MTQLSCIQDIELADINADGFTDLILGYNFYGNRPYFGQYDAGIGDILINENGLSLEPLDPATTGLKLIGDLRDIELIDQNGTIKLISAYNNDSLKVQSLISGTISIHSK